MATLNCLKCKYLISNSDNLAIYQQSLSSSHLITKIEKRNQLLGNIILEDETNEKKKKYIRSLMYCVKCNAKIGVDSLTGPKSETVLCFKAEAIILGGETFIKKPKWVQEANKFSYIELRKPETFYGTVSSISNLSDTKRSKQLFETVFPSINDASNFNIASLICDYPRAYQVELYLHALAVNSVIYLQTGAGKTLIAAMVIAYFKKLNPKKKIFFVCDRIPLVFQQAAYLRYQTGLKVGEFCGENKEIMDSQLKCDIMVFTAGFLINLLFNKTLDMSECSVLIIDEIHHAKNTHPFVLLIDQYYKNIEAKYRPRIVGLTASPTSSSKNDQEMVNEIKRLCLLIQGKMCMPIIYRDELEQIVNIPNLKFFEIPNDSNQDIINNHINNFIKNVFEQLYDAEKLDLRNPNNFKYTINNLLNQSNSKKDVKKHVKLSFLLKLINSLEILSILGISSSVKYIESILNKERENNLKNKTWLDSDIQKMLEFQRLISNFKGKSKKIEFLVKYINEKSNFDDSSRIIIFVRARKTARYICDYLCEDQETKKIWNPCIFMGHANGRIDGMDWYDQQEPALDAFRENNCRLFVSTNVLQEGLDVAECDNVILFDRMRSLTEYIQSRGRARRKMSQFILMGSPGEKTRYQELVNLEIKLLSLVSSIMKENLAYDSKILLKQIDMLKSSARKESKINIYSPKITKFYLLIYLQENENQFDMLITSLKKCKGFIEAQTQKTTSTNLDIFEKMVKCSFEFKNKFGSIRFEATDFVLDTIKYLIDNNNFQLAVNWFNPKKTFLTNSNLQIKCKEVVFGNLTTPFEFSNSSSNKFLDSKFIIQFDLRCILVLCFIKEKLHKFEISFDSIDQFIIINDNEECLDVFVPAKRPSFVYCAIPQNGEEINQNNLNNIEEEYLVWERVCYFDLESSVHLSFDSQDKYDIINALQNIHGHTILFDKVISTFSHYKITDLRKDFESTDFSIRYMLECFISQNSYFIGGKINRRFAEKLNNLSPGKLKIVLEKLTGRLGNYRYLNLLNILEKTIMDSYDSDLELVSNDKKVILIRRATVCPSRIVYHFSDPNLSNRVTRKYNVEHFLSVRFRDEDFNKLNMSQNFSAKDQLYSRIFNFLSDGLNLCGTKYEFLAMSSSQMREHACWLFSQQNGLNATMIRNWMGDFSNIRCIGKYAARLGQSLSSSIETFETNDYRIISDIIVRDSDKNIQYCFTDGIGKISRHKANEICEKYYQTNIASAFQIRFGGFKGVVAVDPELQENQLQFRPSMKKFESAYNKLDILNIANYIPCYLNRQVIVILSSLGIKDESFDYLLDMTLAQLNNLLVDNHIASDYITTYYRNSFSSLIKFSKLNYTFEPFFRSLLKSIQQKLLKDLISKSRIFVEKGRILMGTIDETGTLKENEVFIQCRYGLFDKTHSYEGIINDRESSTFIVDTKVAVAKNPCMHPGDIRCMQAVNSPLLNHMIDCIVFPSVGPRPITNMCSGSDLDGDLYFVTWDPLLIPTHLEEPMDYEGAPAKEQTSPVEIQQVIQFFVNFIENDQLGRIANAHVAISDRSMLGVKDPSCINLAKIFSLAVDFPKTGYVAKFPPEIKNIQYPDFMEKNGISYESMKIIGKMYRKCKNLSSNKYFTDDIFVNPSFVMNGHKEFLEEAVDTYLRYRQEIERIMIYFNCKDESSLFVGFNLVTPDTTFESTESFKHSAKLINNLWEKFKSLFFSQLKSINNFDEIDLNSKEKYILQKASAWYVACYSSKKNKQLKILSFPWILEDILSKLEIKNYDFLSRSIFENYCNNRDDYQSISRFIQKIELKNEISKIIKTPLILCGSFGLFLFEDKNDINLFIYNSKKSIKQIKEELTNYYDNLSLSCDEHVLQCQHDEDTLFTVNDSQSSLLRFLYIRKTIFMNPSLLPYLYTIVHFARVDGIFKILNNENLKLDDFIEFCIQFYLEENLLEDVDQSDDEYYKDIIKDQDEFIIDDWIGVQDFLDEFFLNDNNFLNMGIGKTILKFYKEKGHDINVIAFKSKFFNNNLVGISKEANNDLKNHFFKCFDWISKTTNIEKVWHAMNNTLDAPVFRNKFSMSRRTKANGNNCFAENANMFILSNFENDLDHVDFEYYKGKRRSIHLNRHCWSVKINKFISGFSTRCYNDVILHSLKQFNKAKEINLNQRFRFQLKFGDVYFTNIPAMLLEEASSIPLWQLRSALEKGYKSFSVNADSDMDRSDKLLIMNKNMDEKPFEIKSSVSESIEDKEKKPKPKKRKPLQCRAASSFDSNINTDIQDLHSIFIKNEFETKSSECYIVYIDLYDSNQKKKQYRIKYDADFKLVRIETVPIKWLCVDIRNTSKKEGNRDLRLKLISETSVDLIEYDCESDAILNEKVKNCVFKIIDEKITLNQEFRNMNIFLKHSKSFKYNGGIENWKPIFDYAKIKIPDNFPSYILNKIAFSVSESNEYSENNQQGLFTIMAERKEIFVSLKVDINETKLCECKDILMAIWFIGMVFSTILE